MDMHIGMITCNYFMRVYGYRQPEDFSWGAMCDKWRAEFHEDDFLKLAREIREMGYDALEIWEPTFSYQVYDQAAAARLLSELTGMGFERTAYCIGGWGSGAAGSVDAAYRFASALGAKVVTGCITKADVDTILPAIEAAGRKYGMRYAVENHPSPNLESPEEIAQAILPYETIGANLDTGIYHMQGYDVLKAMDILGGKIYHTHFKDTVRGGEGCLPIGEGGAPLAEALGRFKSDGYQGMLSVEYEYPTDPAPGLKRSLEFIKHHL
jgi:sugar phosphate isomerase/epimerase